MRFVMDREQFDLAADQVQARLGGKQDEPTDQQKLVQHLTVRRIEVGGDLVDLRWKSSRRLAEDAAERLARNGGLTVLSIDVDLDVTHLG